MLTQELKDKLQSNKVTKEDITNSVNDLGEISMALQMVKNYNPVMKETKYGVLLDSIDATLIGLIEQVRNELKELSDE